MAARTSAKAAAKAAGGPSAEELLGYYREMLLIRRFEEKAGQLYGMGLIGGFCHLYIGQEAVAVGIQHALQPGDSVITGYRDHGHMLVCNMDPRRVMAELTGRSTGYSKGKGGSMHMFARSVGFYGGHGIVGGQIPLGTGLAFAHQYREDGGICVAYMGDGAVNQGQVYESFNMAALWKLPILYVIENNRYAMGTAAGPSRCRQAPVRPRRGLRHPRASGGRHGCRGGACQGGGARRRRSAPGRGRSCSRRMTYRYRGHSMSDPAKYRTKEEVQEMRERHDPIDAAAQGDRRSGRGDGGRLQADRTRRSATSSTRRRGSPRTRPEPDPSELWTDILADA